MSEPRLYKICGSCHYLQPLAKGHDRDETEMEPECLQGEDVLSGDYCEYYLNKGRV